MKKKSLRLVPSPLRLSLGLLAALAAGCYVESDESPDDHAFDRSCPTFPGGSPGGRPGGDPSGAPPPVPEGGRDAGAAEAGRGPDAGVACSTAPVDRWKELLVVDPSVVGDGRARNDAPDAPWSFRRRLEEIAGRPDHAADLAQAWLAEWRTATDVSIAAGAPGAPRVTVTPRPSVDAVLVCPWLRRTPGNGCTSGCGSCTNRRLDLAQAPFRLVAIVNRLDLGAEATPCGRDGGELRLVYTAVAPETGAAIPFTVIFEYQVTLPKGQDRRALAQAWRTLGALPFGPTYNAKLAELLAQGLAHGALRRVQTNEIALGDPLGLPWELRQFVPVPLNGGGARLEPTAVPHTPRLALNDSAELARWLGDNRRAILAGDNLLPADLLAGSAVLPAAGFLWRAPGAEPAVAEAFNRNTCNGCHGGRGEADELPFQHVAPAADAGSYYVGTPGPARVSRWLHDPAREDELDRRAAVLQATACGSCGAYAPTP